MQSFASFMAQAAMKNQAKAWGGESVKISQGQREVRVEDAGVRVHGVRPRLQVVIA